MKGYIIFIIGITLIRTAMVCGDTAPSNTSLLDQRFLPPQEPIPKVLGDTDASENAEQQALAEVDRSGDVPMLEGRKQDVAHCQMIDQAPHGASAPAQDISMRSSSEMYKAEDPNRDGVIYLGGDTEVTPGSINPFDFRVRSIEQAKEVKLRVGGILGGKRPAALVNGRTLTKGDRIEGFNVVLVGREGVVVEKNGVFVRLPRGRETLVKEGKAP